MDTSQIGIIALIVANVLFSYKGFQDRNFFRANLFSPGAILVNKEYKRLITSGFLHVNWTHLFFNMFTLYSFGGLLFQLLGPVKFFLIYFVSLIGGNLLSLVINKNDGYYTAVGASGAVSGILFSTVAIHPSIGIGILFIPVSIPGWLFGILFMLYSVYGMQSGNDNIGHEAHIGGAILGLLTTLALYPYLFSSEPLIILAMLVPAIIFLFFTIRGTSFGKEVSNGTTHHPNNQTIDDEYNAKREEERKEIDRILDKINSKGRDSLTKEEEVRLKEYSEK
ncbi:MAG: rhomboid family intramembrane serine protease [Cyclobacteriaceae bacterium]|nr:rhomboid family intramembrane serine protease [Cyclobacteriaceae bacterium]